MANGHGKKPEDFKKQMEAEGTFNPRSIAEILLVETQHL